MATPVFRHGKGQHFKLSDLSAALQDISAFCDSFKSDLKTDRPTTNTAGLKGERHQVTGIKDYTLSISGFLNHVASAKIHGKSTTMLFDQYALRQWAAKGSFKRSIDLPGTLTAGNDFMRRQVLGIPKAEVSFDGLYDDSANAVDAVFRAQTLVDPHAEIVFTQGYSGFAIGQLVEMAALCQGAYGKGAQVDAVIPASGSFNSDNAFDVGVSLHDLTAETGVANFASVDEVAATANGGVGHIHVTAFTGTTATVKIQHSTDNSVWADLITFTAVAGVTKQRFELADGTTVNRYVRAIISAGTFSSMTFVVAFGRRTFTTVAVPGTHRHFCGLLEIATAPTFQYGPAGSGVGRQRESGSVRLQDYSVEWDANGVSKWSATLMNEGTITFDTF